MSALIDTSVLLGARADFEDLWAVSAVTVGELEAGVLLVNDSGVRAARLRRLSGVLAEAPVIAVDRSVAARYAELRAKTGRAPSNDLWIAATALAHDLLLVTRDQDQAKLPLVRSALLP